MSSESRQDNTSNPGPPGDVTEAPCATGTAVEEGYVLVPFFGRCRRSAELPTKPGPQGHNGGITPGYRRLKPLLSDRLKETEAALSEALLRLAALELDQAPRRAGRASEVSQ